MRVDFLGLEAFLCIAERGSFHRAAAHLNLSQTALSYRIKRREDDLGLKLLARTTRQVTLTPTGVELLPDRPRSEPVDRYRRRADPQSLGRAHDRHHHAEGHSAKPAGRSALCAGGAPVSPGEAGQGPAQDGRPRAIGHLIPKGEVAGPVRSAST